MLAVLAQPPHRPGLLAVHRVALGSSAAQAGRSGGPRPRSAGRRARVTRLSGVEHLVEQPLDARGAQPLQADDRARVDA